MAGPSGLAIGANRTIYVTSGNYEDSTVFLFGPAAAAPTRLLAAAKTGTGAGSRIAGWNGCDSTPTPSTCQVTMGSDRSVSAEFEALPSEEDAAPAPASPATAAETP